MQQVMQQRKQAFAPASFFIRCSLLCFFACISMLCIDWFSKTNSALKPLLLPFHVFDHYIVNFAQ